MSCSVNSRYTEALLLFKNAPEAVWQAATLEGMATVTVLDAWAAGHGLVRLGMHVHCMLLTSHNIAEHVLCRNQRSMG